MPKKSLLIKGTLESLPNRFFSRKPNLKFPLHKTKKNRDISDDTPLESVFPSTGKDMDLTLGTETRNSSFREYISPGNSAHLKQYLRSPNFVLTSQMIVIFTFILVMISLFLHVFTNKKLYKSEQEILSKIDQLKKEETGTLNLKEVSDKISVHKDYKNSFIPISPIIDLLNNASDEFEYKSISLNKQNISITSQALSPLSFSRVTTKFLESDLVDYVVLKSASLDNSTRAYDLSLEVILK